MSETTEAVARRLRMRGYDAEADRWDGIDNAPATEVVVINAVLVIGWRYPSDHRDGGWRWDDRPAYLIDRGADPLSRVAHLPYFDSSHRSAWTASRPGKAEEHPRDDATPAELAVWVQKRLPPPRRPDTLLFWHPSDVENPSAATADPYPGTRIWPWTADWEAAWAAEHHGES